MFSGAVELPDDAPTSPLSKYFEQIMKALLATTERNDVTEANLMTSAYEAINLLIHSAAPDVYALIGTLIPTLIARLKSTLMMNGLTGR